MKALSIRQPWAWLIVRPGFMTEETRADAYRRGWIKDIENRDWPTRYRGEFLIHASKTMDVMEYNYVRGRLAEGFPPFRIPPPEELPKGGFVGKAEIIDCVTESTSRWFRGKYGFVLANSKPLPFVPYRGMQGLFNVPDTIYAPEVLAA